MYNGDAITKEEKETRDEVLRVLDIIIADCKQDVEDFDGKVFNGKTLGELHGILEAKIQALAKAIKTLVST